MKLFQIVICFVSISSSICSVKRSTNEELQQVSLNQGEYIPYEEELKGHNTQYGYNLKSSRYYSPHKQEREGSQFMIIKHTKKNPITKRIMIAHPPSGITPHQHPNRVSFAAIHQTKIMPVKVIQEGPVKHVYLPEYYYDKSAQFNSLRTPKAYDNINRASYNTHYQYNPVQHQNYFRPSVQYNYLPPALSAFNQGGEHGYNMVTSGYRAGRTNKITPLIPEYGSQFLSGHPVGFGNNLYTSGAQYLPQSLSFSSYSAPVSSQIPSYQNLYQQFPQVATDVKQKYSYDVSDQYKSPVSSETSSNAYATTQYDQPQRLTSAVPITFDSNQNSNNSVRESKVAPESGLDPELAQIVNDVLNKGKGSATHDGFTMVKSKTDNAIYLIGKPGMSLSTIPNFSAYNYASFQNSEKSDETKTEDMKTT